MNRKYISVHALNRYIKAKLDQDVSLQNVYIQGEVSNFRPHPSGHLYFTLKDESSRVDAIMFASKAKLLNFQLENGMHVLLKASVSVYEASGHYQLYVDAIEQDGIGQLYMKYDALKRKLETEGLFDLKYKKEIVKYPRNIAVLSAKHGAAVQDVVKTIEMRYPIARVIVFPIPVQGKNAFLHIIHVLKQVDQLGFDTIILARGGGSIEDLWNFNEEDLARCIFQCQTPIISGIGHETDFTICDFVSDVRCATPTAAALYATPDIHEMLAYQNKLSTQLTTHMKHMVNYEFQRLERLKSFYYFKNPEAIYSQEIFHLIKLQDQLQYQFKDFNYKTAFNNKQLFDSLNQTMKQKILQQQHRMQTNMVHLDTLSPLKIMCRGYSLVEKNGKIIKSVLDINKDDRIQIQFSDGYVQAKIE